MKRGEREGKGKSYIIATVLSIAILPAISAAAIPMPVVVKGVVKYANGTMVPDGWTVSLENLNESYPDEPWNTTTDSTLYPLNYFITGTAESESTFLIRASDPEGKFYGEETFTASPLEIKIVNITVRAVVDVKPPMVVNPTANPPSIPADGITESQLNVTVTDESGIDVVMIDLSPIGGSATQVMSYIGGDVYSVTVTAAPGTPPGTYCLRVNATDIYGNSNTSVCIPLTITAVEHPTVDISIDKTVYYPGDTMIVTINMTNPTNISQDVHFTWLFSIPSSGYWKALMDVDFTLSPGTTMTIQKYIPIGNWGRSFDAVFIVFLLDTESYEVIDCDAAYWKYMPKATAQEEVTPANIGEEIEKGMTE